MGWIATALNLLATIGYVGTQTGLIDPMGMLMGPDPSPHYGVSGSSSAVVHPGDTHDRFMHRKRRRRRRALTASDKSDIAFIAGILGKAAGGRFAVALGARSR